MEAMYNKKLSFLICRYSIKGMTNELISCNRDIFTWTSPKKRYIYIIFHRTIMNLVRQTQSKNESHNQEKKQTWPCKHISKNLQVINIHRRFSLNMNMLVTYVFSTHQSQPIVRLAPEFGNKIYNVEVTSTGHSLLVRLAPEVSDKTLQLGIWIVFLEGNMKVYQGFGQASSRNMKILNSNIKPCKTSTNLCCVQELRKFHVLGTNIGLQHASHLPLCDSFHTGIHPHFPWETKDVSL